MNVWQNCSTILCREMQQLVIKRKRWKKWKRRRRRGRGGGEKGEEEEERESWKNESSDEEKRMLDRGISSTCCSYF